MVKFNYYEKLITGSISNETGKASYSADLLLNIFKHNEANHILYLVFDDRDNNLNKLKFDDETIYIKNENDWYPVPFHQMNNLRDLNMASIIGTRSNIPKQIFNLQALTTLTIWKIDSNTPVVIPKEISQLINLKILTLSSSKLNDNSQLQNLAPLKLQTLYLNFNELTTVNSIPPLPELEELNIHKNHLTTLADIYKFPKLRILDISNNNLQTISNVINLSNLKQIFLHDNNIKEEEINALKQKGIIIN